MTVDRISFPEKQIADLPLDGQLDTTRDGVSVGLAGSRAERKRRDEAIALVKLLALGSREYSRGEHCSVGELRDRLRKRFSSG
ncbi:type II toxin-antitoxin system prevent-host-death family antitoxin [Pseudomonas wadenswilerensis]